MTYDIDIGMWHKTNFSDYIIDACYKTKYSFDGRGLIKNSYDESGARRNVALLGDSNIEALMVKNENILHNALFRAMNGTHNVLNYGLSGTGPTQHLMILKQKVELEKLDRLIHFVFIENDLADGDPTTFDGTNRPKVHLVFSSLHQYEILEPREYDLKEWLRDMLGHFELYAYLKKSYLFVDNKIKALSAIKAEENPQITQTRIDSGREDYQWRQLLGSIYQINEASKNHGFDYDVAFLSESEVAGDNSNTNRFTKFLIDQEISHKNLANFLGALASVQDLGFECDSHWNDSTHRDLARYLREEFNL